MEYFDNEDNMTQHIDLRETARNNVLAAALALQHCTKTAANIVPIPDRGQIIAIGTPAEVARLLDLAPAATTYEAEPERDPIDDLVDVIDADEPPAPAHDDSEGGHHD